MGFFSKVLKVAAPAALGFVTGGPVGALAGAGAGLGALAQGSAADKAAGAQRDAAFAGIAEQRAGREAFEKRTQPFVDIGLEAGGQLQNLLADPSQGLAEINPVVDFLRNQGFEQIQESAAARGRLGAGGTLKDLTQFNTDLASTVVPQLQNQRFNQLFNVLGVGQNAATGQGTAALNTASNVGNLLGTAGQATAQGALAQGQAQTGLIQNLAAGAGAFPGLFGNKSPEPSGGGFNLNEGTGFTLGGNSLSAFGS